MAELTSLRNIGKAIEKKLQSVAIHSAEELQRIGGKEAFRRMKARHPNVCLVHLYTLQGAVDDVDHNRLPEETKRDLKAFSDSLAAITSQGSTTR
jgi:DNA transformation protein